MNISKLFRHTCSLLATFILVGSISATEIKVNFSNEKVDDAISRASAEGKLVFIDFYASWCTPCKWMDKTTFKDPKVVDALGKSFISVKVNIDDGHGFEMKNKYEINYLPTILILNSKGHIVERVEETMTASTLYSLLNLHDNVDNKVKIKHDFNTSPRDLREDEEKTIDPWKITKEDYYRYVEMEEKRNYKVQVGTYESYDRARDRVHFIRETFFEPVVVVNEYRDGKVLFKVMLGQFESMSEAESFRIILEDQFDIKGVVN